MKEKTAVELLEEALIGHLDISERYKKELFKRAKEMEKQQIAELLAKLDSDIAKELTFKPKQEKMYSEEDLREAFNQSRLAKIFEKDMPPVWGSWEQYYNEAFKSE